MDHRNIILSFRKIGENKTFFDAKNNKQKPGYQMKLPLGEVAPSKLRYTRLGKGNRSERLAVAEKTLYDLFFD